MNEWLHDLVTALGNPEAWQALRRVLAAFTLAEGWQYAAITFAFWFVLHVLLRRRLAHRLISGWPRPGDVRREIAYVGDTLNVAARLLDAAKEIGRDVLVSKDLLHRAALPADLRIEDLPTLTVRGRAAPLEIAALSRTCGT